MSGAQRFFARALHIFFGRPFFFLVPALLIAGAGAYFATSKGDQYRSVGVLSVASSTFLDELTERNDTFNIATPAAAIGGQFNELMYTDGFATSVADAAGLREARLSGIVTLKSLRANVVASAAGDALVRISATADNPELARRLADAAISTFKNHIISIEVEGSNVAESFYEEQLDAYKIEVDAAKDTLEQYLATHPAPVDSSIDRDPAEELAIERLNASLDRAQQRLDDAFDKREAARLATLQSSADIGERLRVLDPPGVPTAPVNGLLSMIVTFMMFAILGVMVTVGAVLLATLLDRSIHTAADLEWLGAGVLAVVPSSKRLRVSSAPPDKHRSDDRVVPMRVAG